MTPRSSAPPYRLAHPLDDDEREGIVLAVDAAFRKLKNLYAKIVPLFNVYGFQPPSAGVVARDLSEKIEASIVQHCTAFTKPGAGHTVLERFGQPWEVKICKDSGLTINQSKSVDGETYIVVNYQENSVVTKIWVLWDAKSELFSAKKANTNARTLNLAAAADHMELILERPRVRAPIQGDLLRKVAPKRPRAKPPKDKRGATAR